MVMKLFKSRPLITTHLDRDLAHFDTLDHRANVRNVAEEFVSRTADNKIVIPLASHQVRHNDRAVEADVMTNAKIYILGGCQELSRDNREALPGLRHFRREPMDLGGFRFDEYAFRQSNNA